MEIEQNNSEQILQNLEMLQQQQQQDQIENQFLFQQEQQNKNILDLEHFETRYNRIPKEKIQNLKQIFFTSYAAVHKNVNAKKLFRKEIITEINEFIQQQIPQHLSIVLPQIELQQYKMIHKLLRIHQNGTKTWFLIHLKENKKQQFLDSIKNNQMNMENLANFGKIIYQGQGEVIPQEIQKQIDKSYNMEMRNKAVDINNKAYLKTRESKYQDSIDLYTKSLKYDKQNCTTYNNRAYCYIMLKKFQDAEEDLKQCLKIDDKFENAYKHLATIYFEKQQYFKSLGFVQKALSLNSQYQEAVLLYNKINSYFLLQQQQNNYQNCNNFNKNLKRQNNAIKMTCSYEIIEKQIKTSNQK